MGCAVGKLFGVRNCPRQNLGYTKQNLRKEEERRNEEKTRKKSSTGGGGVFGGVCGALQLVGGGKGVVGTRLGEWGKCEDRCSFCTAKLDLQTLRGGVGRGVGGEKSEGRYRISTGTKKLTIGYLESGRFDWELSVERGRRLWGRNVTGDANQNLSLWLSFFWGHRKSCLKPWGGLRKKVV